MHLIARQLDDLSGDPSALADRDTEFKNPSGRGDEFAHVSVGGGDAGDRAPPNKVCDMFAPDLHIDTLKVKTRNFQ